MDMEFLNKMWKFQGPRKEINRGDQEKIMWNFHESLEIDVGICKGCNTSFENSRGGASFCLEILEVK